MTQKNHRGSLHHFKITSIQSEIMQQWIIARTPQRSKRFIVPIVYRLTGELDIDLLRQATEHVIARHEILRTQFSKDELGNMCYKIYSHMPIRIEVERKLKDFSKQGLMRWVDQKMEIMSSNLVNASLFRIHLIPLKKKQYYFAIFRHHLISDGESLGIIIYELSQIYSQLANRKSNEFNGFQKFLPPILESKNIMHKEKKAAFFWKKRSIKISQWLKENPGSLIPFKLGKKIFTISGDEKKIVDKLTKILNVSQFVLLISVFSILYAKINRQQTTIIAVPVSKRKTSLEKKLTLGNYVNFLLAMIDIDISSSFDEIVANCKKEILKLKKQVDYPFHKIISTLPLQYINFSQDWPVAFVKSVGLKFSLKFDHIQSELVLYNNDFATKADISMEIETYSENKTRCIIRYNENIFQKKYINFFILSFRKILHQVKNNPKIKIKNFLVSKDVDFFKFETLTAAIEKVIFNFGSSVAVMTEDGVKITYNELNISINSLINNLIYRGVTAGNRVIIFLDRSVDFIVTMLACMKIGVTYVPIESDTPEKRISYITNDSGAIYCLTATNIKSKIKIHLPTIFVDQTILTKKNNVFLAFPQNQIAYIIYTSGTTGEPKGVLVSQRNLSALFSSCKKIYDFNRQDTFCLTHSISFDFSVWEILSSLLSGGKLLILSKKTILDVESFFHYLAEKKVTVLNQTPSALYNLTNYISNKECFNALSLRLIISGGEILKPILLKPWVKNIKKLKIYNMYGITEATIHATYKLISQQHMDKNISNIGKPLSCTKIKILNEKHEEINFGELYLGGDCIASGYLNKPNLTQKKFVNLKNEQGLWLKTGDLVKRLPGGELEYLYRKDRQISLRGYRIEPQEIEKIILLDEEINNAHIFKRVLTSTDSRLVCFIVIQNNSFNVSSLMTRLKKKLPSYMIPSAIFVTDHFPITAHGKIDEQTLSRQFDALNNIASPQFGLKSNTIADLVNETWNEILNQTINNRDVNFFDVGGHSLLLVNLQMILEKKLSRKIPILDLLTHPTINTFSKCLESR